MQENGKMKKLGNGLAPKLREDQNNGRFEFSSALLSCSKGHCDEEWISTTTFDDPGTRKHEKKAILVDWPHHGVTDLGETSEKYC
ncbi:hypothetical protein COOONC_20786 [Cooperia oncophora]